MENLSCSIKLNTDIKPYKALVKKVGKSVKAYAIAANALTGDTFTLGFQNWYKQQTGKEPDINDRRSAALADKMIEYYYHNHWSLDYTARTKDDDNLLAQYGYETTKDREDGKHFVAVDLVNIFRNIYDSGEEIKGNKTKYYLNRARAKWNSRILEVAAIIQNLDVEEVKTAYDAAEDKAAYLKKALGGNEMSIESKNLYAVWQELNGSNETATAYIDEVFCDKMLQDLRNDVKSDYDDLLNSLNADAQAEVNDKKPSDEVADDIVMDDTITNHTNHLGTYSSFMLHVGPRIRNYFNTLPKLVSVTTNGFDFIEDTNNRFGIAETMDANACCSMLYANGDFSNIANMIKQIEFISTHIKGFEAFSKLAADLKADEDFAYELWNMFAKAKLDKLQVVTMNGTSEVRTSNTRSNREAALLFSFMNDLKGTSLNINSDYISIRLQELKQTRSSILSDIKKLDDRLISQETKDEINVRLPERVNNLLTDSIRIIKSFFPSVDEQAIKSYIYINNNAGNDISNQLNNLLNILSIIEVANNGAKASSENFEKIQTTARRISENNDRIREEMAKGIWHELDEIEDSSVILEDYLSDNSVTASTEFTKLLLPYSVVDVQLNTANVMGNKSSDVINNSHLTTLKKMLDQTYEETIEDEKGRRRVVTRNKALEAWGINKMRSKQYKYSNLLLEQYDRNGYPINKAIFRYVNGNLCLTENAKDILQFALFDGSSDLDKGNNELYSKMTEGSFLPTTYIAFHSTKQNKAIGHKLATYFLRTPSDAPKTFTMKGVRYDTSDLTRIDREEVNRIKQEAESIIGDIPVMTKQDYLKAYPEAVAIPTTNDSIATMIARGQRIYITTKTDKEADREIRSKVIKKFDDGTATVRYLDRERNIYVFRGTIEYSGGIPTLINYTLDGVVLRENENKEPELPLDIQGILISYYTQQLEHRNITVFGKTHNKAKRNINKDSDAFKLLKNLFRQEMLNAAVAINHYFDIDENGWIINADENADRKVIKIKDGRDNTKGYSFYHLDSKGRVLSTDENGEYYLGGNVFHSQHFTLAVEDEEGNVSKRNYLDECISFGREEIVKGKPVKDGKIHILYGGANMDSYLHMITTENENGERVVKDVYFTEKQDALIDEKLTEFIFDYCAQVHEEILEYSDLIEDVPVTEEASMDYAINYLLALSSCDDILEGETGFYKNTQTILKRAKEYQGSGLSYGIADIFNMDDASVEEDASEFSYLNNGSFNVKTRVIENGKPKVKIESKRIQDIFKGTILEGCRQRRGFVGVTVANSIMTQQALLDTLVNTLSETLTSEMDKEAAVDYATDILYGPVTIDKKTKKKVRKGGFTETTVNDAQSYITFDEFVRRIAGRGQLKRYMPLIQKILNPKSKLTGNDIKEFIQLQKNFYYDMHYDAQYGIYVPRQIKNAEFVLVPRFIKGTQLEEVYNLMKAAGIDQLNTVETSKAANEEIITLWDDNGDLVGKDAFVQNANRLKQNYLYANLYTQQETPQHLDAENKAGIQIVKKIIDNIPSNHPLYGLKQEYFRLFVSNIRESYNSLLDDIEVKRDEDGNILRDEDGHLLGINKKLFYDKLKDEMLRLGLDKNAIDYVTLDPITGEPKMPSHINSMITKFESIAQSVFNRNITRQKLPGFHAGQVTNIGWNKFTKEDNQIVTDTSYATELGYHPMEYVNKSDENDVISQRAFNKLSNEDKKKYKEKGPAGYIEVLMPLSAFGIDRNSPHYAKMTDEEILKELQEEGLDEFIGYRIPTEGKQSVSVMKVVGFTADAYGSTIVVPHAWVSQTGSDFDIDSIYGIQKETYKDTNGRLRRVNYITEPTQYDWYRYVNHNLKLKLSTNVKDDIANIKESENSAYQEDFTTAMECEKDAYHALSEGMQNIVKRFNAEGERRYKDISSKKEKFVNKLQFLHEQLDIVIETNQGKKGLEEVIEYRDSIAYIIDLLTERYENLKNVKNEKIQKRLEQRDKDFAEEAKKLGLLQKDEYIEQFKTNPEYFNNRRSKNTRICEIMIDILKHPSSLEENLSRSNFDDIIYWRNEIMSDNVTRARQARSPYNIIDQIKFQEDATSGLALKGISVMMDTFCSVCNTVQPDLDIPVYVVYDSKDFKNPDKTASRFKARDYKKGDKKLKVKHDTYGWTRDGSNRNIAGKLLTAYSSQTTAHILDAIKEGNIPGVNIYSFPVYKTLVNIGSDYKTAIGFIMQPGVNRIIRHYNRNNSVFSHSSDNPIHMAIFDIARELGIKVESKTPVVAVLNAINAKYNKEFNRLFKQPGDDDIIIGLSDENLANLPIVVGDAIDRIKEKGKFKKGTSKEKLLLFDLGMVLQFHKLNKIANAVSGIAQCCNPDKFGAKQTVYETTQVFDDILANIWDYDQPTKDGSLKRRKTTLSKNGEHILCSIYPNVELGTPNDPTLGIFQPTDKRSTYPTLYSYLKYASATSTIIARELFVTQHPTFVNAVKGLKSVLSGYNPRLSDSDYSDFQKYVLSYFYNKVLAIRCPIAPKLKNGKLIGLNVITEANATEAEANEAEERARIFGFGRSPGLKTIEIEETTKEDGTVKKVTRHKDFVVEDLYNPTEQELKEFMSLSPAQKVKWIQTNVEEQGIFGRLTAVLYNDNTRGGRVGMQTLEFTEDNINPNILYAEFDRAFYNENPFAVLAAIDLIKYGVVVEGLKLTQRGISKVISNNPLIGEFGINGLSIMHDISDALATLGTTANELSDDAVVEDIYENYLRSNPSIKGIKKLYLNKKNLAKYKIKVLANGIIHLPINKTIAKESVEKAEKEWNERLTKMGIKSRSDYGGYKTNKYIRLESKQRGNLLYKIVEVEDGVVLYPLNPLQANETTQWSSKEENNVKCLPKGVYESIIADFIADKEAEALTSEFITLAKNRYKSANGVTTLFYKPHKVYDYQATSTLDDINKHPELSQEVDQLVRYFSDNTNTEPLYINSRALTNYIFMPGALYGTEQEITIDDNTKVTVQISKVNLGQLERFLRKEINPVTKKAEYVMSDAVFNDKVNSMKNADYQKILKAARAANLEHIDTIFVATKVVTPSSENPQTLKAELEEMEAQSFNAIKSERRKGGELEQNILIRMGNARVGTTSSEIAENVAVATRELANYYATAVDNLKLDCDIFWQDPAEPEHYYSITDPEVQKIIEDNPKYMDKYLKTINKGNVLRDKLVPYAGFTYTGEDSDVKFYLDNIKNTAEKLSKLPIDQAAHNFAVGYVTNITTNPTIVDGLISIMDNYWKTYGSMWKFHDVMENGTPLLQTILKDVMGNVEAKTKMARRNKIEFNKKLDSIIEEARKHGESVNFNKFIDEYGYFVKDYSIKFDDELTRLRTAVRDAKIKKNGSIEYLKAKLEYDEFKAKHIQQRVRPEYYIEKCKLERIMIEKAPEVYEEYSLLKAEQIELLDFAAKGGLSPEKTARLREIYNKIKNLTANVGYYTNEQGEWVARPTIDENVTYTSEEKRKHARIYSSEAATALRHFIDNMNILNSKYFEYSAAFGFEEQLKRNLAITRSFENRDANGIPTTPTDVLENNETYIEAKRWLAEHARYVLDRSSMSSFGQKVDDALRRLSMTKRSNPSTVDRIISAHMDDENIYDEFGRIDGRLFTEAEVKRLKDLQRSYYGTLGLPAGTDRILISSAKRQNVQYSKAFYDNIKLNGSSNPEYLRTVTELNSYLEKYYDASDGVVHLDRVPDTEAGIAELNTIAELYMKLKNMSSTVDSSNGEEVTEWISENCEDDMNLDAYRAQALAYRENSQEWRNAWMLCNLERRKDGSYLIKDGRPVPNRKLYSTIKPKGEPGTPEHDRWVDKQRTEDINLINEVFTQVKTPYYYMAMHDAMREQEANPGSNAYQKWYEANHVYNPFTRKMEPLPIWVKKEYNTTVLEENDQHGAWAPVGNNVEKSIKTGMVNGIHIEELDMRNHNWKGEGSSLLDNYVKGSQGGIYDSNVQLNEYEKQARDLIQSELASTARTEQAKKALAKGMPSAAKKEETLTTRILKEAGKFTGFVLDRKGKTTEFTEDVDYADDTVPAMPMTQRLRRGKTIKVEDDSDISEYLASDNTIDFHEPEPQKEDFVDSQNPVEEYNAKHLAWEERRKQVEEHNRNIHKSLLDRNWRAVMNEYFDRAAKYNAVEDNREKLYYLLHMLENQKAYMRKHGLYGELKLTKNQDEYDKAVDDNLIDQYKTFMRRLLFDQWKEDEGWLTDFGRRMQGGTSASYMMANIKAGISNVTVGETSILAEAKAGDYFNTKDWRFGTGEWIKGSIGFARCMYKETAVNKQDAIIKWFKVVDYDEITGVSREVSMDVYSKRLRDIMFSPQTMGEHFMQNSVLFAMLHSHKIVDLPNDPLHINKTIMSEAEYVRYRQAECLVDILSEEQMEEFTEWKKDISKDKNKAAAYAWWRRNVLTDFVALHCSKEQRDEFIKKSKEQVKRFKEEFNNKANLYDQLTLKDGYMGFVENSELAELDEQLVEDGKLTKAYALLGTFTEEVRKVNNKIHGVYNRLGQAWLERKWYGSLVMQYHKHLPTGILKRYRARGFYSEFRRTPEKGMLFSFFDFMNLNLDIVKHDAGWTEEEANAAKSFKFLLSHCMETLLQLQQTWHLIPEHERANMRRNLGDLVGVVAGLATIVGIIALGGGDDDDDDIPSNFLLYEADRLATEAFLYNPLGLFTESKKIMSTPIAAESLISDGVKTILQISNLLIGNTDDLYYKSGRFAHQNKLLVYIQRRIPVYSQIKSILEIPENNHFFKMGDSAVTLFPSRRVGKFIGDMFD